MKKFLVKSLSESGTFQNLCNPILSMYHSSVEIPWGIVVPMQDCNIKVSKFELQSCNYVHFRTNILGKGMNSLIPSAIG